MWTSRGYCCSLMFLCMYEMRRSLNISSVGRCIVPVFLPKIS